MTSKIKVDNINKVSDDSNVISKCGSTVTVGSAPGNLRSGTNNLQASDGGNLISQSGTTITIGASGDTVALASGASQSGFGDPASVVLFCTTKKTSPFTAASKVGYFIDTSSGGVTVTLPSSPSAGDIVAFADYTQTFQTNSVSIARNGSNIGGVAACASLSTKGQSVTMLYVDATEGWITINDTTSAVTGEAFICASGGTTSTCGDYKVHTFTSSGCFAVSSLALSPANNKASYLVVGGGGSAADNIAGGGGGGGFREGKCSSDPYTASPAAATPCSALTLSVQTYPITIGAGGASTGPAPSQTQGGSSTFSTITSAGGGQGGRFPCNPGGNGGSGGGGAHPGPRAGTGNTPPVSPPQGNPGGASNAPTFPQLGAGGGGGASATGGAGTNPRGGDGGDGHGTGITKAGTPASPSNPVGGPGPNTNLRYFSGGGGGGIYSLSQPNPTYASGGAGGGAASWGTGNPIPSPTQGPRNGTANSGGGAAQRGNCCGGVGGSGIVIIRYKFQ